MAQRNPARRLVEETNSHNLTYTMKPCLCLSVTAGTLPTAAPPIPTPAPGPPAPPLPVHPAQPTLQDDCIGRRAAKKPSKKKGTKDAAKKKPGKGAKSPEMVGQQQPAWPSGISERDGEQAGDTGPGAWPSGISRK